MTTLAVLLVAAAALATGAVLGALVVQLRAAGRIEALRIELAAASVRLEASALNEADRLKLLEESETRLRAAFDSLAGETLRTNSELFLRLAREALGRDQAVAAGALRERELAIEQLVQPLRAALERTEAQVQSLECERREAFATLRTQIETLAGAQTQLQRETRNLATALRRPELLETALGQNVIIATPSTLIALLKAVAYGWRQAAVAHNAALIRDLGQELYRRLATFNGHLGRMGQRLATAVEAYNAAVGSLERHVLPQARRFGELGVTADAPLPELEPIVQLTRSPGGPSAAERPTASPPAGASVAAPVAAPGEDTPGVAQPGGSPGASNARQA